MYITVKRLRFKIEPHSSPAAYTKWVASPAEGSRYVINDCNDPSREMPFSVWCLGERMFECKTLAKAKQAAQDHWKQYVTKFIQQAVVGGRTLCSV